VDGIPLDDPFSIQEAICDRLREKMATESSIDGGARLPNVCEPKGTVNDEGGAGFSPFGSWMS
jgi:hypothetical protein